MPADERFTAAFRGNPSLACGDAPAARERGDRPGRSADPARARARAGRARPVGLADRHHAGLPRRAADGVPDPSAPGRGQAREPGTDAADWAAVWISFGDSWYRGADPCRGPRTTRCGTSSPSTPTTPATGSGSVAFPRSWSGTGRRRSSRPYPGRVLTLDRATYDGIVAHAKRDHPDEACGIVAGPEGSDRPERLVEMVNAAGSPTFYEFDSTELLALYKELWSPRRGAGRGLPLPHRHRGLPEPHRHRPGERAAAPTTCWSAPASTGITRARWSSGRIGSSTAR